MYHVCRMCNFHTTHGVVHQSIDGKRNKTANGWNDVSHEQAALSTVPSARRPVAARRSARSGAGGCSS